MSLASEMAAVAAGCFSRPNKMSVWSDELGKFICVEDPRAKVPSGSPTIDPAFKPGRYSPVPSHLHDRNPSDGQATAAAAGTDHHRIV